jgi:hypothetical protein
MNYEPSEIQLDEGARKLVIWETGLETWPDSWHPVTVFNARLLARRVWKAMWTAESRLAPKTTTQLELFEK